MLISPLAVLYAMQIFFSCLIARFNSLRTPIGISYLSFTLVESKLKLGRIKTTASAESKDFWS